MAEEKIITVNLRKRILKVPRWKRQLGLVRLLKRRVKGEKVAVSQKLNESLWKSGDFKFRVKVVRDGKNARLEPVE